MVLAAVLAFAAACEGEGSVGDDCSKEADEDECEDGAFCAKTKSGRLSCLEVCVEQSDCPTNTECTGAKDKTKVCQPKE